MLAQTDGFDFYHLPEYHMLAEERGEGKAFLFLSRESSRAIAWPFLLRPINTVEGCEQIGNGLQDATSVYGYPGLLYGAGVRGDKEFLTRFGVALRETARELCLVGLFSRMHPLFDTPIGKFEVGTFVPMGTTVSIDLSETEEAQWSQIRKGHRHHIRKATNLGVKVWRDHGWTKLDEFVRLYNETMERKEAANYFFFGHDYFMRLRDALRDRLHLFVAEYGSQICSAGLFTLTGSIIQYHLSGNDHTLRNLNGFKLILDEVRHWGKSVGAKVLHLGGGVGSKEDSLFDFKAGFSHLRHQFYVWRHIVQPEAYWSLVQARRNWLEENNSTLPESDFFPLYRAEGIQPPLSI